MTLWAGLTVCLNYEGTWLIPDLMIVRILRGNLIQKIYVDCKFLGYLMVI